MCLQWHCRKVSTYGMLQGFKDLDKITDSYFNWPFSSCTSSGSIKELLTLEAEDDYVSSVSWIQQGGTHIAVGTASNAVQVI